ncbi:MAG TPA: hypothetical protein PKW95_00240 [bacterium]|nr:hypothetical protein [bacterium]
MSRWETAVYVVFLALIGWWAHAYFPTEAFSTNLVRAVYFSLAFLFLLHTIFHRPWLAWADKHPRLVRSLWIVILLVLALSGSFMIAYSLFLLFTFKIRLLVAYGAFVVVLLAAAGSLWLLKKITVAHVRFIVVGLLWGTAVLIQPLSYAMWRAPAADVCDAAIVPGVTMRLSPADYPAQCSQPYFALYLPEKKALFASFKMSGNLTIRAWDRPAANNLVSFDLRDADRPRMHVLPMHGPFMPENIVFSRRRQALYLTMVGYTHHRIAVVDIADYPHMKPVRTLAIDFEPNAIFFDATEDKLIVLAIDGKVHSYDPDALTELHWQKLPSHLIMHAWHTDGARDAYVAPFFSRIFSLDTDTLATTQSEHFTAGGGVIEFPEMGYLFHVDPVADRMSVFTVPELQPVKSIKLEYKPRPVFFDAQKGWLIVGDWFGGKVYVYDWLTMRLLAPPTDVGPYLRSFAYDAERQLLFACSKCGVYRIRLDKLIYRSF